MISRKNCMTFKVNKGDRQALPLIGPRASYRVEKIKLKNQFGILVVADILCGLQGHTNMTKYVYVTVLFTKQPSARILNNNGNFVCVLKCTIVNLTTNRHLQTLLEIGLFNTHTKIKISSNLGCPNSYFYNERRNMLL